MSEILVETTRGKLIENIVRGSIAVVDATGKVIASVGEPMHVYYMRSTAKPLQASAVAESGAIEQFGISTSGIAVMCGSHVGDDYHVAAVEHILAAIGLDESLFTLGEDLSSDSTIREHRLAAGISARKIYNNCSGKHAGMLALCRFFGWDTAQYQQLRHPVQQLMLETVAAYAEMNKQQVAIGIDGCGVPVFGMPLANMAIAYRNLANADAFLPQKRAAAAKLICAAMQQHPEMVEGNGCFASELIRATNGRIIAKYGADGVFCCAEIGSKQGIAVKTEDGNVKLLSLIVLRALQQLNLLQAAELQQLQKFATLPNINCQRQKVGESQAVFQLV